MSKSTVKKSGNNSFDQDTRIEGIKNSIIAVYGDALDKIGFGVAEKANRYAQARLGKTIKTLNTLENKDETFYRKKKYALRQQLGKLQQEQIKLKRSSLERSKSLDDVTIVLPKDSKLHSSEIFVRKDATDSNAMKADTDDADDDEKTPESEVCGLLYDGRRPLQRVLTEPLIEIPKQKSTPGAVVTSEFAQSNQNEGWEPASEPSPVDIRRCEPSTNGQNTFDGTAANDACSKTINKAHFNMQPDDVADTYSQVCIRANTARPRQLSVNHERTIPQRTSTDEGHATIAGNQQPTMRDDVLKSFDVETEVVSIHTQPRLLHRGRKKQLRYFYHGTRDVLPPTTEEMLRLLTEEKRELRGRVHTFLSKENPGGSVHQTTRRYKPMTFI